MIQCCFNGGPATPTVDLYQPLNKRWNIFIWNRHDTNVLVCSLCFILIPMLWVHYNFFILSVRGSTLNDSDVCSRSPYWKGYSSIRSTCSVRWVPECRLRWATQWNVCEYPCSVFTRLCSPGLNGLRRRRGQIRTTRGRPRRRSDWDAPRPQNHNQARGALFTTRRIIVSNCLSIHLE